MTEIDEKAEFNQTMKSRKSFMDVVKTTKPKIKIITEREVNVSNIVKPILNLVGITTESKIKNNNDEKSKEK